MFSNSCKTAVTLSKAIQRTKSTCPCILAACPNPLRVRQWEARRTYSSSGSIFQGNNTWDHILAELDKPKSHSIAPTPRTLLKRHAPRQSITKREAKLLSDMLNRILDNKPDEKDDVHLGLGGGKLQDLFGQLRRHRPTTRRTDESTVQEMVDVKKEQMSLCENDLQLLEWAQDKVFGESIAFEETAKKAVKGAAQEGKVTQLPTLQPPTYPHMVAALMKTFRERYRDPHLALAIFNHAQNLSIVSYVFGCSTDAYNELLETRWSCFHDMQGVLDALEEMKVNAVPVNSKTRTIVDRMRADIGQSKKPIDSKTWEILQRIEKTIVVKGQKVAWDSWKSEEWDEDSVFDDWKSSSFKGSGPGSNGSKGGWSL